MDAENVLEKRNKMNDTTQAYESYQKVKEVIKSCNNEDQLRVGVRMFNLLLKKYGGVIEDDFLHTLTQLIGLMRIKCGVEGNEEVNEETSEIGKEFRSAAAMSDIPELKKISFDENEEVEGGIGDNMDADSISEKYEFPLEDIKKEIHIGGQIEKEHTDNEDLAEEFAIDHIVKFIEETGDYDYYTDPEYGIIAVEDRMGENKKTIRISKSEMDKLHDEGKLSVEDINLTFKDEVTENLDMNDITQTLRKQLKKQHSEKFSKEEIFDKIRQKREEELGRREKENEEWVSLWDEDEIEESTGAASAGAFEGPLGGKEDTIRRSFAKSKIPVSVNGIDKPIGKLYSFNPKPEVIEEDEIEEATGADSAGAYVGPRIWANNKKNWRGAHKKAYPGGKFVNIKKKCSTHPYCNQGWGGPGGPPITLTNTSDMKIDNVFENKIIKKGSLKIKKQKH